MCARDDTRDQPATDAAARLARDGPNEIGDIGARSDLEILLGQFNSVPVALLAGSGAIALASRALGDAAAIAAVLVANGGIGFVTERRAEHTVSALRRITPGSATVLRWRFGRSMALNAGLMTASALQWLPPWSAALLKYGSALVLLEESARLALLRTQTSPASAPA